MHAKPVLFLAVAVVMVVVGVWAVGPRPETAMAQGPESPEAVAEAFYAWYLDTRGPIRRPALSTTRWWTAHTGKTRI